MFLSFYEILVLVKRIKIEIIVDLNNKICIKFILYEKNILYVFLYSNSDFVKLRESDGLHPALVDVQGQDDEEGCNEDHQPYVPTG